MASTYKQAAAYGGDGRGVAPGGQVRDGAAGRVIAWYGIA